MSPVLRAPRSMLLRKPIWFLTLNFYRRVQILFINNMLEYLKENSCQILKPKSSILKNSVRKQRDQNVMKTA